MASFTEQIRLVVDVAATGAKSSLSSLRTELAQTDGAFNKMKVAGSGAFDFLKQNAAGIGLAAGTAIAGFAAKAVADFQATALGAGKLRDALGVTADEASRLQEVAGDVGVPIAALEAAIGRMNRVAGDTPDKFDAAGAAIVRNADGTTNVTQTFIAAAEALRAIPDAAERAARGQEIFGRGWMQISELIMSGSEGIREAMASVEAGKLIDDAEIDQARNFRDAMDDVKGVIEETTVEIGGALVPLLTDAAEQAKELSEGIRAIGDIDIAGVNLLREGIDMALSGLNPSKRFDEFQDGWQRAFDPEPVGEFVAEVKSGLEDVAATAGSTATEIAAMLAATDPMAYAAEWGFVEAAILQVGQGLEPTATQIEAINILMTTLGLTEEQVLAAGNKRIQDRNKLIGEATGAQDKFNASVADAAGAVDAMSNSVDDIASAFDRMNAASSLDFGQMAQDTVASFDAVKEAIGGAKDSVTDWSTVDLTPDSYDELKGMPEAFGAITDAVAGMRGTIQTELAAAFETGGIDAYTSKAQFFRDEILAQFPAKFREMGASQGEADAQTQALIEDLGLLPEQVEIVVQLTRVEQAQAALDAFSSVIAGMPPEVQVAINTAIAQGSVETALGILNTQLINRGYDPIVLPVDADTGEAVTATDEIAGQTLEPATIPVGADTGDADSGIDDVISTAAGTDRAIIRLLGNTSHARTTLNAFVDYVEAQSPSVGVDAFVDSIPSATEIARMIGAVRVPVDAYVRSTPRISGIRNALD